MSESTLNKNINIPEEENQLGQFLEAQKGKMLRLKNEEKQLEQEIEEKKHSLKLKRKELRQTSKEIDRLISKSVENSKTKTEQELYQLVALLMESGQTADDILKKFQE